MKKIIISLIILTLISTTGMIIYGKEQTKKETQELSIVLNKSDEQIKIIEEKKDLEQILRNNGCYEDEVRRTMNKYIEYTVFYEIDEQTVDYFITRAEQKYEVEKLLDIYSFIYMANKDYSKMDEMYEMGKLMGFQNKNWIEKAYNNAFNRKSEVLSVEDVGNYIKAGLSYEDISLANRLSFKNVLSIREILYRKIEGESFSKLASEIYAPLEFSEVEDFEIIETIRVAQIMEENPKEVFDKNEQEKISKKTAKKLKIKKDKVDKKVNEKNYDFSPFKQEIKEIAKSKLNDIEEAELDKLLAKGYLIKEIEKGIENSKKHKTTIEDAIMFYN